MAKQYTCNVKLKNKCWVKYRAVNDLKRFTTFIDTKEWLFFNVYEKGINPPILLASFQNGAKRNVPVSKHL